MIFNLLTMHLGDVLMAMPAMRAGDIVLARPEHRVPGLGVNWFDMGNGLNPYIHPDKHTTDSWLAAAERDPVRHELLAPAARTLTVIAPAVEAHAKRWGHWGKLTRALPQAYVIDGLARRDTWMYLLNRAHTVICPDTGTAHMADALGVPKVVALHGNSQNWARCAPYWNRAHCVVRDSMAAITVNDVLEAAHA